METDNYISIRPARGPKDLEAAAQLFSAYAKSLGLDLGFQDFATEVTTLPGKYAPPEGEILLAYEREGNVLGCVALRPLSSDGCCEMKRLYVTPAGRGFGLGRKLVDTVLDLASSLGYGEVKLDTLSSMHKAREVYEKSGFQRTEPYYQTPLVNTVFYARKLGL